MPPSCCTGRPAGRRAGRAGLLTGLTLLAGCVSFSATPLAPEWTASSEIRQQSLEGLSVAVRPLHVLGDEQDYIGRPARARGYLPLVLLLENTGNRAFLVRREGIILETVGGRRVPASSLTEVYDGLSFSKGAALWGLPLGIFPAFLMGNQIDEQNDHLLSDLRRKAFHDIRLHRNPRQYNSILFFPVGDELASSLDQRCWVDVEVELEATTDLPGDVLRFRLGVR